MAAMVLLLYYRQEVEIDEEVLHSCSCVVLLRASTRRMRSSIVCCGIQQARLLDFNGN